MTIEEVIETIEYARAFNKENTPLMKAFDVLIDYVKFQQETSIVRCKDCALRNTPDCAMWCECEECKWQFSCESDDDFCSWGIPKTNEEEENDD